MKAPERVQNTQRMMKKLEHGRNEKEKNKNQDRVTWAPLKSNGTKTIRNILPKNYMASGHFFNLGLTS